MVSRGDALPVCRGQAVTRSGVLGIRIGKATDGEDHVSDTYLVGMEAGHEACSSGTTSCGIIELTESNSIASESIEGWGFHHAPVGCNIGPAHIVDEYEDDVRAWGSEE